jgi:hypothetical protein
VIVESQSLIHHDLSCLAYRASPLLDEESLNIELEHTSKPPRFLEVELYSHGNDDGIP